MFFRGWEAYVKLLVGYSASVQAFPSKIPSTSCLQQASVRIAQLVERWSNKPLVLGSIPNVNTLFVFCFFFFFRRYTQYKSIQTRLVHLSGCVAAFCDPCGDKGQLDLAGVQSKISASC